jgi:AcrR family transcriptional regulator
MTEETNPETPSKSDRTRQAIIDAAYGLIIEQGYAATSMRQIADRAGLALGGIYNHFPSKADVFRVIMLERHPFRQIMIIFNSAQGDTIEEYVRNLARSFVDTLGQHPDFLNLMLIEIVEFKGEHVPAVFELVFPTVLPLGQRIAGLPGTVRNVPAPVLVRAFLGMFFSYYITGILLGPVMPPEMQANSLDYFVEIFLHGVLSETPA